MSNETFNAGDLVLTSNGARGVIVGFDPEYDDEAYVKMIDGDGLQALRFNVDALTRPYVDEIERAKGSWTRDGVAHWYVRADHIRLNLYEHDRGVYSLLIWILGRGIAADLCTLWYDSTQGADYTHRGMDDEEFNNALFIEIVSALLQD